MQTMNVTLYPLFQKTEKLLPYLKYMAEQDPKFNHVYVNAMRLLGKLKKGTRTIQYGDENEQFEFDYVGELDEDGNACGFGTMASDQVWDIYTGYFYENEPHGII